MGTSAGEWRGSYRGEPFYGTKNPHGWPPYGPSVPSRGYGPGGSPPPFLVLLLLAAILLLAAGGAFVATAHEGPTTTTTTTTTTVLTGND